MVAQCRFSFDPESWSDAHNRDSYVGEPWRCPHDAHGSAELCVFHLPPSEKEKRDVDAETVTTALEETAATDGERAKQLIGARFGDITLDRTIVSAADNHRLDLRHATVAGEFSLTAGELSVALDLRGATLHSIDWTDATVAACRLNGATVDGEFTAVETTFTGDVDFTGVTFGDRAVLDEARFNADTCLQDTQFEGPASFDGVEFRGDANLLTDDACFERARFHEAVTFTKAEFRYADFIDCRFGGKTTFDETTFTGDAEFRAATFATDASFRGVTFEGDADILIHDADFTDVHFGGLADFDHATFAAATFEAASFAGGGIFRDTEFEMDASFTDAAFEADCEFVEARFRGDADFTGLTIAGDAICTGVEFQGGDNSDDDDVTFADATIDGAADFQDARFRFANFSSFTAGEARFVDAVFSDDAVFTGSRFRGALVMDETRFRGDTSLAAGTFDGPVSLRGVEFDGHQNAGNDDVTFAGATFADALDCSLCAFGNADFSGVEFGEAVFSDSTFREEVTFEGSEFRATASFDETHFEADTTFAETTFHEPVRFRGAEFHGRDNVDDDDVTFAAAVFDGDVDFYATSFRYANFTDVHVTGDATFDETVFTGDGDFDRVTFDGPVSFDEARFRDDTSFVDATATSDASFRGVEFQGGANITDDDVTFAGATFAGSLDCTAGEFAYTEFTDVQIEGPAMFTEAQFTDDAAFEGAQFGDRVVFDEARFRDDAAFDDVSVTGAASFRGTEFHGGANVVEDDLSMVDARFADDIDFHGARFRYVSLEDARVAGEASFDEAVFNRDAVFAGVTFESAVSFEEARFRDDAAFENATIDGAASFRGAEFQGGDNLQDDDVTFEGATFDGEVDFCHVEFEYANFESVRVAGRTVFEATTFADRSSFADAHFEGAVCFEEATFEDDTAFCRAHCDGAATFYGVEFEGGPSENDDADFEQAVFADDVDFRDAECDAFGFEQVSVAGTAEFRNAVFGALSVATSQFEGAVDMSFCQFTGQVDFAEAECDAEVTMDEARLESDASFAGARFGSEVSFRGAEFSGDAHTIDDADFEATVFRDTVDFEKAEFRFGNFSGAEFHGNAIFVETTFGDGALFQRAEFDASGLFARAIFADETDFSSTAFADSAYFDEVQFNADTTFADATFESDTTFEASEFEGSSNRHNDDANFESATFLAGADFTDVSFRYTNFTNTEFAEDAWFEGISVADSIVFRPQPTETEETLIHLENATLRGGTLGQPEGGRVFYDLTGGSVGAVRLDDAHCDLPLFDHFRFADTDFDGFDFTSHKAHLAENNWIIHEFAAQADRVSGGTAAVENTATLENTYLKAKNAAADFGDRKAAAEFFIKEMLYRRKKNWDIAAGHTVGSITDVSPRNRLRSLGKWVGNHILYQTCGYGERLWRVLYVSGAVILFWGLIYTIIPQGIEGGKARGVDSLAQLATPEGLIILGRNIYFSTATFITLEYVGGSPAGSTARWLASLEAFSGALLIALVVFVLGRRVAW